MFYIEIINNEITRYTESEKVANKFYENFTESKKEPVRGFDGKLYLKSSDIPKQVLTDEEKYKIQCKIFELENKITSRRMREATFGDKESIAFIKDVDKEISLLRKEVI